MSVDVLGLGLITPIALDPGQHAAFLAAGLGVNPPSAFLRGDAPLPVRHAPWLAANAPISERLLDLASRAITTARASIDRELELLPTILITANDHVDALAKALGERHPIRIVAVRAGAASAFDAIADAAHLLEEGSKSALVVAADSMISLETIRDLAPAMSSAWTADPAPPSEGAAALLLGHSDAPFARVHSSATAIGAGSDDDEVSVDGAAMTSLLRALPVRDRIAHAYGQARVDRLRLNDWTFAVARNSERFDPAYEERSLEDATGALGAAAGLANVVYAIARERADDAELLPVVAWAISSDGRRGLASIEVLR